MARLYAKLFLIFCAALLIVSHEITIQVVLPESLLSNPNLQYRIEDSTGSFNKISILALPANSKPFHHGSAAIWVVLQEEGKPPLYYQFTSEYHLSRSLLCLKGSQVR